MLTAHKWQPITDLPANPRGLTDGELESLARVWRTQKEQLSEQETLEEFDRRLRREWAIETGIIENAYSFDRGVTQTLIEKGIDAALITHEDANRDTTLVARIIQDHYDALDGMFDFVAGRRQLSTSYVKEIHAALLRNVDVHVVVDQFNQAFERVLEKGQYKTAPNSPIRPDGTVHEYAPPEHVASEMDALIAMYLRHETQHIPPEVEAAWLHHRFSQIHPFADGNGRVARALASLVFIKAGWFPLIIKREDKVRYIEALEQADDGDLRPLVSIFVQAERNALVQATEVAFEVPDFRPITSTHEAVLAARDRLVQQGRLHLKEWGAAKGAAAELTSYALGHLDRVAADLTREIGNIGRGFNFTARNFAVGEFNSARETAALRTGHAPDFSGYNACPQLTMNASHAAIALSLSFHGIGPRFRGLIGVVPFLTKGRAEPEVVAGPYFLINYEESLESVKARFSTWLDSVIVRGLNMWRLSL